tara:strand:+ start:7257 stop:7682 length:426 start_codon:yes stop_codon:yes gene_type:complete
MRLFIEHLNIDKITLSLLEKYKCNEEKLKFIFSEKGIIKVEKNLIQYDIKNIDTHKIYMDNYNVICDKSEFIRGNKIYSFPKLHFFDTINVTKYALRPKATIQFVHEINNNNINTCYFESKENPLNVKDDIDTFLSLLNFS